jgi:hypothetical protein
MERDLANRYWVFAYSHYYPCGGLHDLAATFETLPFAQAFLSHELGARQSDELHEENEYSFAQSDGGEILDTKTNEIYGVNLDTGKLVLQGE